MAVLAFAASALAARAQARTAKALKTQTIRLVIKSDTEHGKKGPDGKWHDAFLPGSFTVHRGARVVVTVLNYDDMPHSFTSPGLHVNKVFMMGKASKPSRTTFTFVASKAGRFAWHCMPACDAWSMAHVGYMKGYVTVK